MEYLFPIYRQCRKITSYFGKHRAHMFYVMTQLQSTKHSNLKTAKIKDTLSVRWPSFQSLFLVQEEKREN